MIESIRIKSLKSTFKENSFKIALLSKQACGIGIIICLFVIGTFVFKNYFTLLQTILLISVGYNLIILVKMKNLLITNKKINTKLKLHQKKL
jgi:hypothetical protein